jgi:hypothetical protein
MTADPRRAPRDGDPDLPDVLAAQRDRAAFATLYRRYLDRVVAASKGIAIVVGFVDANSDIYNAAAVIHDGALLPNTEFGHLILPNGKEAEKWAAASVREEKELSWERWAERLQEYYTHLEFLFSPDLFVVGGGVSKKSDQYLPLLELDTPIVPAGLRNDGGIIGAALLAGRLPEDHSTWPAG